VLQQAGPATGCPYCSGRIALAKFIQDPAESRRRTATCPECEGTVALMSRRRARRTLGTLLPPVPESAQASRQFVATTLGGWELSQLIDDVELIVSELVTNAVAYAREPIMLTLTARPSTVRVEVEDDSPAWPIPRNGSAKDEAGRGLVLVGAMSRAWGVRAVDGIGKAVWADVPIDEPLAVATG